MKAAIAVLSGDGIGPEVTAAATRVLECVASAFGHDFTWRHALIGGAAIDATGQPLPPDTVTQCRQSDAVLLGAVGGPKWDTLPAAMRPEAGLLGIRRELELYANIRPVSLHPRLAAASPLKTEILAGVDLVVVRELTGGIYFGAKSREVRDDNLIATDVCTYSVAEIERVTRVACALASRRKRRVVSVDKANVLETSRLWRETVTKLVKAEYPEISVEHMLVDACAMHLIRQPSTFDVILTENMFGDILTDEASVLAGSIGLLPSASLGAVSRSGGLRMGLYEPIHGSAPTIAGRGIANPIGAILSAAMLLRSSLGLGLEADAVERAVATTLDEGIVTPDVPLPDRPPVSTTAVTDAVIQAIPSVAVPALI